MKKRILSLLLVLCLAVGMFPAASAAEAASGTCGENLTWTLDSEGTLTISGEGPMDNYTYTGNIDKIKTTTAPWFRDDLTVKKVVIGPGVTKLGHYAFAALRDLESVSLPEGEGVSLVINSYVFANCDALESIYLPESITKMGNGNFRNCSKLTTANIPASLTALGTYTFKNCVSLKDVDMGEWNYTVDSLYGLFYGCSSLEYIDLPDNLINIGYDMFNMCTSLKEIDLPAGIKYIGDCAFSDCVNLTEITFPSKLQTISYSAFFGTSIETVTIPASVLYVQRGAFAGCPKLTEILVEDGNHGFVSIEGVLYESDLSEVVQVPGGYTGVLNIAEGVQRIGDDIVIGFDSVPGITEIHLPSTLVDFDNDFYMCPNVTAIRVAEDNPTWFSSDDGAVYAKDLSRLLAVPAGYPNKDFYILDGTQQISGATYLGGNAFTNCTNITDIHFPASVCNITTRLFTNCGTLTGFWVDEENPTYYSTEDGIVLNRAYTKTVDEAEVTVAEGSEVWAFPIGRTDACVLPEGVTTLTEWSLARAGIQSLTLPESFRTFEEDSLYGCEALNWIRFTGDLPDAIPSDAAAMGEVECIVYYPGDNATWDTDLDTHFQNNRNRTKLTFQAESDAPENPFTDVPAGSFYEAPVLWALENNITSGTSATTFSPGDDCMRAYVVTFLWRAAGCPEPKSAANPFVDVAPGSFYEKPVLWAVEKGITNGADATHFNPAGVCNRAQIVTFLYRAFGSPAVDTNDLPFGDVPADSWCAAPVAWAVKNEITNGLSATSFGPNTNCNRAQVVTFLYRAYN